MMKNTNILNKGGSQLPRFRLPGALRSLSNAARNTGPILWIYVELWRLLIVNFWQWLLYYCINMCFILITEASGAPLRASLTSPNPGMALSA